MYVINDHKGRLCFQKRLSVILSPGGGGYDITSCLAAWSHVPSEGEGRGGGGSNGDPGGTAI